jgi:hypothetical protein
LPSALGFWESVRGRKGGGPVHANGGQVVEDRAAYAKGKHAGKHYEDAEAQKSARSHIKYSNSFTKKFLSEFFMLLLISFLIVLD